MDTEASAVGVREEYHSVGKSALLYCLSKDNLNENH